MCTSVFGLAAQASKHASVDGGMPVDVVCIARWMDGDRSGLVGRPACATASAGACVSRAGWMCVDFLRSPRRRQRGRKQTTSPGHSRRSAVGMRRPRCRTCGDWRPRARSRARRDTKIERKGAKRKIHLVFLPESTNKHSERLWTRHGARKRFDWTRRGVRTRCD